jgi:hypothetical protein
MYLTKREIRELLVLWFDNKDEDGYITTFGIRDALNQGKLKFGNPSKKTKKLYFRYKELANKFQRYCLYNWDFQLIFVTDHYQGLGKKEEMEKMKETAEPIVTNDYGLTKNLVTRILKNHMSRAEVIEKLGISTNTVPNIPSKIRKIKVGNKCLYYTRDVINWTPKNKTGGKIGSQLTCSTCGTKGHNARTCTQKTTKIRSCSVCGKSGHNARTCTEKVQIDEDESRKGQPFQLTDETVYVRGKTYSTPTTINHPEYYNTGSIEVIDAIEDWELDFNAGNVVKYVVRAKHKDNEKEDLEKALWYIQRMFNNLE